MLHVSEAIDHMIFIFGILMWNDDISMPFVVVVVVVVFSFSLDFYISVVSGVKGQKMAKNDKKFCLSYSISQEP